MRLSAKRLFLGSFGLTRPAAEASANTSMSSSPGGPGFKAPRSALFVPCSNLKALAKVKTIAADAFILDLEDSVPVSQKVTARDHLVSFVKDGIQDGTLAGKRLVVRINSPTYSPETMRFGQMDLDAVALLGDAIEAVGIPKTSARDATHLDGLIHPHQQLWAFFETPRSILEAGEICASGKYTVAAMGLNDLSMELQLPLSYHMATGSSKKASKDGDQGATSADCSSLQRQPFARRLPLLHAMSTVINAARAYGVEPLDGVFNDPTDTEGLVAELREAKMIGFSGKTLIHPGQIAHTHAVLSPSEAEVEWARAVVAALEESRGGVAVVDGKMVEELHGRMARRLLAYAPAEEGR